MKIYFINEIHTDKVLFYNHIRNIKYLYQDIYINCPFEYNPQQHKITFAPFSFDCKDLEFNLKSLNEIYKINYKIPPIPYNSRMYFKMGLKELELNNMQNSFKTKNKNLL